MHNGSSNCDIPYVLLFTHAGFRVKGDHEEEVVVDHCTLDTFDSMQSAEDTVTVVNPGQRYNNVYLSVSGKCAFVLASETLVTTHCADCSIYTFLVRRLRRAGVVCCCRKQLS